MNTRLNVLLLVDRSMSMYGASLQAVSQVVALLRSVLLNHRSLDPDSITFQVMLFNTRVEEPSLPSPVREFAMPELEAYGLSSVHSALDKAMALIHAQKAVSPSDMVSDWLLCLFTDGDSTDAICEIDTYGIQEGFAVPKNNNFIVFACGPNINRSGLRTLSQRTVSGTDLSADALRQLIGTYLGETLV